MKVRALIFIAAFLFCGACASTSGKSAGAKKAPVSNQKASEQLPDGLDSRAAEDLKFLRVHDGAFHVGTQHYCPEVFGKEPFDDMRSERNSALRKGDSICGYRSGDIVVTRYITYTPTSLRDSLIGAVQAMQSVYGPRGFNLNQKITANCNMAGLMVAPALGVEGEGPFSLESAVFTSDDTITLVQVSDYRNRILKVRMTKPAQLDVNEAAIEGCALGAAHLVQMRNGIVSPPQ